MRTANRSDTGRIRLVNEDRSWVGETAGGLTVAIVADGMGGHRAGDVASQMTVDAFREAMQKLEGDLTDEEAADHMRQAILRANAIVYEMASRNEQYHNMGTTVVAALLKRNGAVIGHIGDSRAYKLTADGLVRLTEDHTLVNELAKAGQISAEEALNHPRRNVLTRALGTDANVEVDVIRIDTAPGEAILLCSDGLTNMVSESQMLDTLRREDLDLDGQAERLIELALEAGGDDNISVILLKDACTEREG
ncbi:serine/threonine protein phosphatase [Paenibacillus sp. 32O-W]|uniref:Stp1/IreP family PP2C-type Ser/Thr phosphatase n=1 Tax=Paenibacillus sp. 32O-W TaxID=1695218 RepID=UPI0007223690|nr:Stp1/IreP family PP2C-type Ser/Thr phosphatase [Paenibacillus sp. 32O-W]ALS27473.1 serine/threonine protein phosphatase [Paenibacillus sp. 32O-W]